MSDDLSTRGIARQGRRRMSRGVGSEPEGSPPPGDSTVAVQRSTDPALSPRAAYDAGFHHGVEVGRDGLVTHGRHCRCSACARQDWTDPNLAPCGMHGPSCPPVYAPITAETAHWPTLVFEDGDVGDLVRCDCGEQGYDWRQGREWFAKHMAGTLDVVGLAVAMNTAQITAEEIRLGHDLRVPAERIAKAYNGGRS